MSSVNKVILLGRLGRDPETRHLPSGKAVANVSIATSTRYKNQAGESVEDTQWHRVTFYDRLAEIADEYLRKGDLAYIEGRIKYGKYTDKDGIERNSTDIIATTLQLLGSKSDSGERGTTQGRKAPASDSGRRNEYEEQRGRPARPAPAPSPSGFDDMDDDIPF